MALFLSGPSGGGAQRRVFSLANALAVRGHRVDVVVARSPHGPHPAIAPTIRLVALDSALARVPGIRSRRGLWVLASTAALARYLRQARPDVLLSTSHPANIAAALARTLARAPVAVVPTVNTNLSGATGERQRAWGPLLRVLACQAYNRADEIIAISEGVADDLARRASITRRRITTVYNPVAAAEILERACEPLEHPWLAPDQPPVVLGVGKLKIQKDFATLLRAFARVCAQRPARLVILGEGEELRRLVALGSELGVADNVSYPGFVENPFAWMARASVFVLSSAWEGFSNALAEALACGCPVVSTDCPSGPAELLDHGTYGRLVPVGDDRALANAIIATLEDRPDPERLRARAAEFSVNRAAAGYLAVLARASRRTHRLRQEDPRRWSKRADRLPSSSMR